MSKPKSQPVPQPGDASEHEERKGRASGGQPNEPLSGSKKVKNHNHVSHNNPQG